MNVQSRLLAFLQKEGMSKLSFANSINRSPSYVTNMVTSIGPSTRKIIASVYPQLNMNWLLTGEGEMYNIHQVADDLTITAQLNNDFIPLLPISAQAGTLNDFTQSVSKCDCEMILSPIKEAEFAVPITGDSMSPEYPSGAKVIVRKINDKAFIDWGRTYVLDTCNGIVIKNVYPSDKDNHIRCVSINPNFPSFDICVNDIYGWYRVLMSMSLK